MIRLAYLLLLFGFSEKVNGYDLTEKTRSLSKIHDAVKLLHGLSKKVVSEGEKDHLLYSDIHHYCKTRPPRSAASFSALQTRAAPDDQETEPQEEDASEPASDEDASTADEATEAEPVSVESDEGDSDSKPDGTEQQSDALKKGGATDDAPEVEQPDESQDEVQTMATQSAPKEQHSEVTQAKPALGNEFKQLEAVFKSDAVDDNQGATKRVSAQRVAKTETKPQSHVKAKARVQPTTQTAVKAQPLSKVLSADPDISETEKQLKEMEASLSSIDAADAAASQADMTATKTAEQVLTAKEAMAEKVVVRHVTAEKANAKHASDKKIISNRPSATTAPSKKTFVKKVAKKTVANTKKTVAKKTKHAAAKTASAKKVAAKAAAAATTDVAKPKAVTKVLVAHRVESLHEARPSKRKPEAVKKAQPTKAALAPTKPDADADGFTVGDTDDLEAKIDASEEELETAEKTREASQEQLQQDRKASVQADSGGDSEMTDTAVEATPQKTSAAVHVAAAPAKPAPVPSTAHAKPAVASKPQKSVVEASAPEKAHNQAKKTADAPTRIRHTVKQLVESSTPVASRDEDQLQADKADLVDADEAADDLEKEKHPPAIVTSQTQAEADETEEEVANLEKDLMPPQDEPSDDLASLPAAATQTSTARNPTTKATARQPVAEASATKSDASGHSQASIRGSTVTSKAEQTQKEQMSLASTSAVLDDLAGAIPDVEKQALQLYNSFGGEPAALETVDSFSGALDFLQLSEQGSASGPSQENLDVVWNALKAVTDEAQGAMRMVERLKKAAVTEAMPRKPVAGFMQDREDLDDSIDSECAWLQSNFEHRQKLRSHQAVLIQEAHGILRNAHSHFLSHPKKAHNLRGSL